MEEECGLLNIELGLVKTDPELIKKLFARLSKETKELRNPYINESQVRVLMRYNVWTIDQFCDISGLKVSSVNNLARPTYSVGQEKLTSKLNYCFPCPDSGGRGPKYIVRNEKSEKYVKI